MVAELAPMRTKALGIAGVFAFVIGCGDRVDATSGSDADTTSADATTFQTEGVATAASSGTTGALATSTAGAETSGSGTTGADSCYVGLPAGEVAWKVGIVGHALDIAVDSQGRATLAGEIVGEQLDWWVASYDSGGGLLWEDTEAGPLNEAATVAVATATETYLLGGYDLMDEDPGTGQQRIETWVRQYSVDGSTDWILPFPHGDDWVAETPVVLGEDTDGHRILVTRRRQGTSNAGVLRRITATGEVTASADVAWDDENPGDRPLAVGGELVPGAASEVVVVGSYEDDRWAVRIDPAGEILWSRRWPCAFSCGLQGIAATPDGDFVITGRDPEHKDDPWAASLRGDGALDWQAVWGMPGVQEGILGVTVGADGTIVVVGKTYIESTPAHEEGWIRKLSPTGELIWETALVPETNSGAVTLSAVGTGGDCGGIWITGTETGVGGFLAVIAP